MARYNKYHTRTLHTQQLWLVLGWVTTKVRLPMPYNRIKLHLACYRILITITTAYDAQAGMAMAGTLELSCSWSLVIDDFIAFNCLCVGIEGHYCVLLTLIFLVNFRL